jgi:glycine cleavage system H lipoate-binding protein
MRCPFLKETEARFCQASPFRKLIFRTPCPEDEERCSSPEYVRCPSLAGHEGVPADAGRCPFLQTASMQFCEAASVSQFIPCSDSLLSACQGDGHRYCDLYLSRVEPERGKSRPADEVEGAAEEAGDNPVRVNGIQVPRELAYAPNHLWLDLREDGSFHLGADAFLGRVLGRAEKVSFVATLGVCRPVAVLRVRGTDLHLAFPNPLTVDGFNVCLRTEPHRLVNDPYGRGWLFSGRIPFDPAGESRGNALAGLRRGEDAVRWMRDETALMTRFVQERCHPKGAGGEALLSDGGSFAGPLAPRLESADLLDLFNGFFSLNRETRVP